MCLMGSPRFGPASQGLERRVTVSPLHWQCAIIGRAQHGVGHAFGHAPHPLSSLIGHYLTHFRGV